MELVLTAVFEEAPPEHGGGYIAYVEELPGANTQGCTLEEARENLRDAIGMIVQANRELCERPISGQRVVREKITVLQKRASPASPK